MRRIILATRLFRDELRAARRELAIVLATCGVVLTTGDAAIEWTVRTVTPALASPLADLPRSLRILIFGGVPALALVLRVVGPDWLRCWRECGSPTARLPERR